MTTRRTVLKTISALSTTTLAGFACGDKQSTDTATVSEDTNTTDTATDTQTPVDTGSTTEEGWVVGGTDLITASYPDNSIFDTAEECVVSLTGSTTKGPCYFQDSTGEDISEGFTGLPMMLCLKLIDSNCQPLSDHTVEVWHCDANGVYSGDTTESADANNFSLGFCTGGDEPASRSSWYRGQLVTDADGRVNFKSCFPGWYPGRTVHIHFAVSDANGSSRVISQFCFTDALADEVYINHPLYSHRGQQDTPLLRDGVFPADTAPFLMHTAQNSDGTLLAYHTIQVT